MALAVAATLCSGSALAQEFTQEQIDAIVAKAVDKALAEREAKMDAAINKKADVVVEPQSAAQTPDLAIPYGVKFTGYARYGAHYQSGDQKYVGVDGSYNGASAIGRLATKATAANSSSRKRSKAITARSGTST